MGPRVTSLPGEVGNTPRRLETARVHFLPLSLPCPWHRQRKDELEQRMSALQESRRELMVQLEGLMKLLKVRNVLLLEGTSLPSWGSGVPALLSPPKTLPDCQQPFPSSSAWD